jgi:hypothetical protein
MEDNILYIYDDLSKAAKGHMRATHHKYIRREFVGKPDRPYEYYYYVKSPVKKLTKLPTSTKDITEAVSTAPPEKQKDTIVSYVQEHKKAVQEILQSKDDYGFNELFHNMNPEEHRKHLEEVASHPDSRVFITRNKKSKTPEIYVGRPVGRQGDKIKGEFKPGDVVMVSNFKKLVLNQDTREIELQDSEYKGMKTTKMYYLGPDMSGRENMHIVQQFQGTDTSGVSGQYLADINDIVHYVTEKQKEVKTQKRRLSERDMRNKAILEYYKTDDIEEAYSNIDRDFSKIRTAVSRRVCHNFGFSVKGDSDNQGPYNLLSGMLVDKMYLEAGNILHRKVFGKNIKGKEQDSGKNIDINKYLYTSLYFEGIRLARMMDTRLGLTMRENIEVSILHKAKRLLDSNRVNTREDLINSYKDCTLEYHNGQLRRYQLANNKYVNDKEASSELDIKRLQRSIKKETKIINAMSKMNTIEWDKHIKEVESRTKITKGQVFSYDEDKEDIVDPVANETRDNLILNKDDIFEIKAILQDEIKDNLVEELVGYLASDVATKEELSFSEELLEAIEGLSSDIRRKLTQVFTDKNDTYLI